MTCKLFIIAINKKNQICKNSKQDVLAIGRDGVQVRSTVPLIPDAYLLFRLWVIIVSRPHDGGHLHQCYALLCCQKFLFLCGVDCLVVVMRDLVLPLLCMAVLPDVDLTPAAPRIMRVGKQY